MKAREPIDYSGLHAPPGSREWILTQRSQLQSYLLDIRNKLREARLAYADIQKYGGWQHLRDSSNRPFKTFEQFCESVNGLRLSKEKIEERLKLGEHGRPKKGGEKDSNTTFFGRGAAYTLARLRRDSAKDLRCARLLRKVESGELSANAAAIEAGWRKKLTPLDQIHKLIPKLTAKELAILIGELQKGGLNGKASTHK